mmetsp:Transcript_16486/g.31343  ORF Transcript_16486/g.31343 Transcript_16486/m.31343 type:complete len:238 (-) Transcript_16486:1494-2207(-)
MIFRSRRISSAWPWATSSCFDWTLRAYAVCSSRFILSSVASQTCPKLPCPSNLILFKSSSFRSGRARIKGSKESNREWVLSVEWLPSSLSQGSSWPCAFFCLSFLDLLIDFFFFFLHSPRSLISNIPRQSARRNSLTVVGSVHVTVKQDLTRRLAWFPCRVIPKRSKDSPKYPSAETTSADERLTVVGDAFVSCSASSSTVLQSSPPSSGLFSPLFEISTFTWPLRTKYNAGLVGSP